MPLRYFLLREVPFGQDGSYSAEAIVNRVNAELANSFGNLAQRTLSMIFKNLDGVIPAPGEATEDRELARRWSTTAVDKDVPEAFERFAFSVGIEAWLKAVFACNAYVDAQAPWALRKTDPERMAAVLGTLVVADPRSWPRRSRRSSRRRRSKLIDADRRREGRAADRASRCRSSRGSSSRRRRRRREADR